MTTTDLDEHREWALMDEFERYQAEGARRLAATVLAAIEGTDS